MLPNRSTTWPRAGLRALLGAGHALALRGVLDAYGGLPDVVEFPQHLLHLPQWPEG